MPTRAFYRVPRAKWPPKKDPETGKPKTVPNARIIKVATSWVYLHSSVHPNSYIEETLDGEHLGETWTELHTNLPSATRSTIFEADIEIDDGEGGRTTKRVPRNRIGADVVAADWLIPHAWGASESESEKAALDAALE